MPTVRLLLVEKEGRTVLSIGLPEYADSANRAILTLRR